MNNSKPEIKLTSSMRYPGEFSEWLEHEEEKDQQVLEIKIFVDNDLVGFAFFGYLSESRGGHLACLEINVKEEFRRQGLATQAYNLAEAHYGDTCKPYPGNSLHAQAFWQNRMK